jgi:putative ABC transport system permease protein
MKHPPNWIDRVLEYFLKERFVDEVLGDLHEWYYWKQESYGPAKLKRAYLWNAIRTLRLHQLKKVKNLLIQLIEFTMINNNIKIGIRSLLQSRFFTFVNVFGLTLSLLSFVLIYAFIRYEKSYNDFHPKHDEIYRVLRKDLASGDRERPLPSPFAQAFLRDFEGDMEFARFGQDPVFVKIESQRFYENDFYWSDASVLSMFNLPFVYGNPKEALTQKNTVVLTKQIAEKYFGAGVNPVGKALPIKIYDGNVELQMRIDGVIEDIPANSDLPFQLLGSMKTADDIYAHFQDQWWLSWQHVYVHIPNANTVKRIQAAVPEIIERELGEKMATQMTFDFQPLGEVHLYSEGVHASLTDGSIRQVMILTVIGIFILLIASINYLNLFSARMSRRKKEVGIRRVMGAGNSQIISQFFTESSLTILLSFCLALCLTWGLWPIFNDLLEKEMPISILMSGEAITQLGGVVLIMVALSGVYPAFMVGRIRTRGLVDKQATVRSKRLLQKSLVTFQFAITVFLVVCSVLIFRQVNYMSEKDLGFDKDQLVSIKVEDKSLQEQIDVIKNVMKDVPGVLKVTASGESLPSDMNNGAELYWGESGDEHHFVYIIAVDEYFFETIGIPLIEGQNFTATSDASLSGPVIMNEAAVELLEQESVLGTNVRLLDHQRSVIGVVQDYHYKSLKNKVEPIIFIYGKPGFRESPDNIILRLSGQNMATIMGNLGSVWDEFSSEELFDYHFVDDTYASLYHSDRRFLKLFSLFTFLSIVVSCLGLYGVVLFATDERSKEISIRKVLGSTVFQVTALVSGRFVVLILIGLLVGLPVALYFIDQWLTQFSYQLTPEPVFVSGALLLVVITAGLTIGLNTVKAALANPIKHLRDE